MGTRLLGVHGSIHEVPGFPNPVDPTMTPLYHVMVHCGNAVVCRYATLVDLDGERREWLGLLELSVEVPCADAA